MIKSLAFCFPMEAQFPLQTRQTSLHFQTKSVITSFCIAWRSRSIYKTCTWTKEDGNPIHGSHHWPRGNVWQGAPEIIVQHHWNDVELAAVCKDHDPCQVGNLSYRTKDHGWRKYDEQVGAVIPVDIETGRRKNFFEVLGNKQGIDSKTADIWNEEKHVHCQPEQKYEKYIYTNTSQLPFAIDYW